MPQENATPNAEVPNTPERVPKPDPTTLPAYLWRITEQIMNSPILLALLLILVVTLIIHATYIGYDVYSPLARYLGMEKKTDTQAGHLSMIGTYNANWKWEGGEDNDFITIENVYPLGKNEKGSVVKGKGCSPSLGAYTFDGIVNEWFISLTYVCSQYSTQPTTVGTILMQRTPNGLFEGNWYGWVKNSAKDLEGGQTSWVKVSEKVGDNVIFTSDKCK
jgi:hypothetical protein